MTHSITNHNQGAFYIAGDWGSTHLRLWLVDQATGMVHDHCTGPGISLLTDGSADIAATFFQLTESWRKQFFVQQALLCGVVGSNIGWLTTDYISCPISLLNDRLAPKKVPQSNDQTINIQLVPGLKCLRENHIPDSMRGEETQLIGALLTDPALSQGEQLVCLPGTHSKWVWLNQGSVGEFITGLSGELFAVLEQHSVLLSQSDVPDYNHCPEHFALGIERTESGSNLIQLLFETRSRQLSGQLSASAARAFLSGLIIGSDIRGIMQRSNTQHSEIAFIGKPELCNHYQSACQQLGYNGRIIDGEKLVLAGLHFLMQQQFLGKP
ncbi:MAG: 2-dehydro-3-deoxygalactonokinase [Porticoccaceae bacterium]